MPSTHCELVRFSSWSVFGTLSRKSSALCTSRNSGWNEKNHTQWAHRLGLFNAIPCASVNVSSNPRKARMPFWDCYCTRHHCKESCGNPQCGPAILNSDLSSPKKSKYPTFNLVPNTMNGRFLEPETSITEYLECLGHLRRIPDVLSARLSGQHAASYSKWASPKEASCTSADCTCLLTKLSESGANSQLWWLYAVQPLQALVRVGRKAGHAGTRFWRLRVPCIGNIWLYPKIRSPNIDPNLVRLLL